MHQLEFIIDRGLGFPDPATDQTGEDPGSQLRADDRQDDEDPYLAEAGQPIP